MSYRDGDNTPHCFVCGDDEIQWIGVTVTVTDPSVKTCVCLAQRVVLVQRSAISFLRVRPTPVNHVGYEAQVFRMEGFRVGFEESYEEYPEGKALDERCIVNFIDREQSSNGIIHRLSKHPPTLPLGRKSRDGKLCFVEEITMYFGVTADEGVRDPKRMNETLVWNSTSAQKVNQRRICGFQESFDP
ncbi:hypothetical protein PISMIDRAFT_676592 [Pisolithus microcarpus 441]|uniref:Uncharacterized protein n=1 Tax=Pisolithus microcarpus 441 TaxID=765257 RepID=A0A0C9ZV25_9AGAM|nr:hypothetical protein PISMIDRAFT_676592 [Pisolithus microcarpus 441]